MLNSPDMPDQVFIDLYKAYIRQDELDELCRCAEAHPARTARLKPHLLRALVVSRRYYPEEDTRDERFHQTVAALGLHWTDDPDFMQRECRYAYKMCDVGLFSFHVTALGCAPLTPEQLAQCDDLAAIDRHMGLNEATELIHPCARKEFSERRRQCIECLLPRAKNANA